MASEIDKASEKYFKRNWSSYIPEKFKFWVTLSFRAGVMWERKKNKSEKEKLIENVDRFIRTRLPRVIDKYYTGTKCFDNVLNEDIREDLRNYLIEV